MSNQPNEDEVRKFLESILGDLGDIDEQEFPPEIQEKMDAFDANPSEEALMDIINLLSPEEKAILGLFLQALSEGGL